MISIHRTILQNNFFTKENSFLEVLHKECRWDHYKYNQLDLAVYNFTKTNRDKHQLDKALCQEIVQVYVTILHYTSCHYNPADGFIIQNLAEEDIADYVEKTELRLNFFFSGETSFNEKHFGNAKNPLI